MYSAKLNEVYKLLKESDDLLSTYTQPILDEAHGVRGSPHRHVYMMATVWKLSQQTRLKNLNRPLRVLEIGSYIGSSILTWDQALQEYCPDVECEIYSIDPLHSYVDDEMLSGGNSKVGEIEYGVRHDFAYKIFRHNISFCKNKIVHFRDMSKNILRVLQKQEFDIIYIDGDHSYSAVISDLREALELLDDGGILCGDDLECQMHEVDVDFGRSNLNSDFINDPRTDVSYHPGVTFAVGEVLGKVPSWKGFWAVEKSGEQLIPLSLKSSPLIVPNHFSPELKMFMESMMSNYQSKIDAEE